YSEEELEHYIDTEKPYDKAGAYAIQEGFGKFIDHIDGSRENVIGLPFKKVKEEILKMKIDARKASGDEESGKQTDSEKS
ncbi:MAG: Maf family protein, partial [Eubacteriales bacterium]|nr:Maf family protein [Eubacteriales bacterium]